MSIDMNDDMNMDPIEREREVERWLDAALTQYAKAEPRAGLEGRVLAGLRAEPACIAAAPVVGSGGGRRSDGSNRRRGLVGTGQPRMDSRRRGGYGRDPA